MNKLKTLSSSTKNNVLCYATVIILYIILQSMINGGNISNSLNGQLIPICAYVVMAISLNLTVGISGELSLGHAGFMSVGAFSGVVTSLYLQDSIESTVIRLIIAIIVGGICAAIAGVIIGIPVLRLKGDYLAIVTLAFGEIIKNVMNVLYVGKDADGLKFSMLENTIELGEDGKMLINGPMGITGATKIATFTIGVILVIFTLFVVLNLINSRSGRAIMAVRDNRIAAESIGIPVTNYKLLAFTVSAALAGMAGTLFASNYSTVVASKFDFNTSILILVFVVLGGLGNVWGSMIAAIVLTLLPEILRPINDYRMLIYSIILISMMLFNNSQFKANLVEKYNNRASKQKGGDA